MAWHGPKPNASVAERRRRTARQITALRKQGVDIDPIELEGRSIAATFWGQAWCNHLESFSDYENRLPRGRNYVHNGSVSQLAISRGRVEAKVGASQTHKVRIRIKTLTAQKWRTIKRQCAGQIGSLHELLRGELSDQVIEVVTDRHSGLFPHPGEISFDCDCPDWAVMCKHIAAVLYGVGVRLDQSPARLFQLRGVHYKELIDVDPPIAASTATGRGSSKRLASANLADVFGIDLDTDGLESKANGATATTLTKQRKMSGPKKANKTHSVKPKVSVKQKTKNQPLKIAVSQKNGTAKEGTPRKSQKEENKQAILRGKRRRISLSPRR